MKKALPYKTRLWPAMLTAALLVPVLAVSVLWFGSDNFRLYWCRHTAREDLRQDCISSNFQADPLTHAEQEYLKKPLPERLREEEAAREQREKEKKSK